MGTKMLRSSLTYLIRQSLVDQNRHAYRQLPLRAPSFSLSLSTAPARHLTVSSCRRCSTSSTHADPHNADGGSEHEAVADPEVEGMSSEAIWEDDDHSLSAIIKCDDVTARRILRFYPEVGSVPVVVLRERLLYLFKRGVKLEHIHLMPWLLTQDADAFEFKVKEVGSILSVEFDYALPFTRLGTQQLCRVANTWRKESKTYVHAEGRRFKNRLKFLEAAMDIKKDDLVSMCARYWRVGSMKLDRMLKVLKLLKDVGVKSEHMVEDPWIFSNNIKTMMERIEVIKQHQLEDVRVWMLRCDQRVFDKYLVERKLLAGHPDRKSFLRAKLGCTEEEADAIIEKVPSVEKSTATKLNAMIDSLYAKGYTPEQIIERPYVLNRSVQTVEARFNEMQSYKFFLPTALSLLCLSNKDYMDLVKRLDVADQVIKAKDKDKIEHS